MKKIFIILAVLSVSIAFHSCSNDDDVMTTRTVQEENTGADIDPAYASLLDELDSLNARMVFNEDKVYTNYETRRSLKNLFKKILHIVKGDIAGAIAGSKISPGTGTVVGAVVGSLEAALTYDDNEHVVVSEQQAANTTKFNVNGRAMPTITGAWSGSLQPTRLDSMGYYHNAVIVGENKVGFPNENFTNTYKMVEDITVAATEKLNYTSSQLSIRDMELINRDMMMLQNVFEATLAADFDETVYNEKMAETFPEYTKYFSVVNRFLTGLTALETVTEQNAYIKSFAARIRNSALTVEDKQVLGAALSVGVGSYALWNVGNSQQRP